jgi:uncharacterized protein YxeA
MKKVLILLFSVVAVAGLSFLIWRDPKETEREEILKKARDKKAEHSANRKIQDDETKDSNKPEGL